MRFGNVQVYLTVTFTSELYHRVQTIHALYTPTKLCDGAQMAIFGVIFAFCIFIEPRAAHFRPAV